MKIRIYWENPAPEFWYDVENTSDLVPKEVWWLGSGIAEVLEVTKEHGETIRAWCQARPSFSLGPDYAKDALIFQED